MADANVPFWQRATGPLRRQAARFPFERAILMGLAAVVGLYGGIAAGLFATAIRFVQLVVFRGAKVASSLFGNGRVAWLRLFQTRLGAAHWHLESVALAALLLIAAAALDAVGAKRLPMFEVHRIRAVALAAALGLSLYYPLLLMRTFNGTFHETAGGGAAAAPPAPPPAGGGGAARGPPPHPRQTPPPPPRVGKDNTRNPHLPPPPPPSALPPPPAPRGPRRRAPGPCPSPPCGRGPPPPRPPAGGGGGPPAVGGGGAGGGGGPGPRPAPASGRGPPPPAVS